MINQTSSTEESEAVCGEHLGNHLASSNMFTQSPFADVVRMTRNFPFTRKASAGVCVMEHAEQLTLSSSNN